MRCNKGPFEMCPDCSKKFLVNYETTFDTDRYFCFNSYESAKEFFDIIKTRLNKTFGIASRSFGKILQKSVEKNSVEKKIPEPDYAIHIPFNVKEVKIYDRKIHIL